MLLTAICLCGETIILLALTKSKCILMEINIQWNCNSWHVIFLSSHFSIVPLPVAEYFPHVHFIIRRSS